MYRDANAVQSRAVQWLAMPEHFSEPVKPGLESLSVSSRNLALIINFCGKRGISEQQLLADLGYAPAYLKNPDHWIPLSVFIAIAERVRHLFNDDPNIIYEIGLTSAEEKLGVFEALKKIFAIAFANPRFLIEKIPDYNKFFNRTKFLELISIGPREAFFKIKFFPEFDATADFISGPFMRGVLGGIPKIWGLPPAQIDELLLEYDLVRLLREEFKLLAELKDGQLFIEDQKYGHCVSLIEDQGPRHNLCLGTCRDQLSGTTGILITKPFSYKSYPLLQVGQIYNAPYGVIRIRWQTLPLSQRIMNTLTFPFIRRNLYLHDLEEQINYFQQYTKELEGLVGQRSSELIEEKAEVEKWKRAASKILGSQLPAAIAESMIRNRLLPRKNVGTILFADLVGFTERLHTAPSFLDVVDDLRRFFETANLLIKGNSGWLYKYLGDGTMAVFGGYQREEDHIALGLQALRVAVKLRQAANASGWQLRIGLEHGEFISGEVGPREERAWDFLGNPVNFAFRLQATAAANEILIGGELRRLLGERIKVSEVRHQLKGLGECTVYTFLDFSQ